jgi:hypothetical protein
MGRCRKCVSPAAAHYATFTATALRRRLLWTCGGQRDSAMTTKVCTNSKCPAYAHFVYTVAMRCVLCRCDLMAAAHRNLEVGSRYEDTDPNVAAGLSRKSARTHARQIVSRGRSPVP